MRKVICIQAWLKVKTSKNFKPLHSDEKKVLKITDGTTEDIGGNPSNLIIERNKSINVLSF